MRVNKRRCEVKNDCSFQQIKMTIANLTIGMNKTSTTYGPFGYGSHAGQPVVDFAVSARDQNQMEIQSIEKVFDTYNWKRKVDSGFARLQFNGQNVFDEQHREGIGELCRILNARFVDFEVQKQELETKPTREIQNLADYYRVFVPTDREFNSDVMQFYAEQSNNYDNVDFIFKVSEYNDDEYINSVVNDYRIYDSNVWLYPKGRKMKTVSERMDYAVKFAKKNTWNVSNRLGVMANAYEEIVDEDDE